MLLSRTRQRSAVMLAVLLVFLLPLAADAQTSEQLTITADGVGDAVLGMTAEQLGDALGDDYVVGDEVRITVDFNGRVITRDGEVQFRAATTDDSDQLTLFIISNPAYSTDEGIGASSTIEDAEEIYGQATLAWNPDNEGREFVSFANGPDGRIAFRTPGIGGTNVGLYDDDEFETNEYEDQASIAAIWLSCVPGTDCPLVTDAGVQPTATPEPAPEPTPTPDDDGSDDGERDDGDDGDGDDGAGAGEGAGDGELPQTGANELILMSVVASLFVIGGAFALMERRYLCPAWLARR